MKRSLFRRVFPSWSALACRASLLGALAACGPTPTEEPAPAEARSLKTASAALAFPLEVSAQTAANAQLPSSEVSLYSAVAAGNGIYFLVWLETTGGGSDPNVVGVRIRESDGVRLDSTPIAIATTGSTEVRPAVAFDGTNFLVVWEADYGGTIRGRRIRASDGAPLGPSRIYSPAPYYLTQEAPALAFDGTNFLLTWHAGLFDGTNFQRSVHALRIRPSDGEVLDAAPFPIGTDRAFPHVASTGGTSLVVWTGEDGTARASRVSAAGQVLDASPLLLGAANSHSCRVAAQGGEFLVAWGSGGALKARRVRASDGALLGGEVLLDSTLLTGGEKDFSVLFDGANYQVLWKGSREGTPRLLAVTVRPDGSVVEGSEQRLADFQGSGTSWSSWVDAAPVAAKRYLATYTQESGSAPPQAVYRRLNPFSCSPDVTPPVLHCPAAITVECVYSGQETVGNLEYADNCGINYVSSQPQYIGQPGTQTHSAYATDTSNNTTFCSTEWTVRDTEAPSVYLNGPEVMRIPVGGTYNEPGYWGEDGCEGYGPWINSRIQVIGTVDTSVSNAYPLEYRLTDRSGNVGSIYRWVIVSDY